ncbi:MAG: NAD(P)-binding domain-containing protein [Intestinibacter sp.]|uniref:NAD(P)-binding domain-containing protein n=1 Tax=Intestinibacter sp. TaxID=1965304 RepID=UPI0025B934B6|nr:NAD(P)-binding domain-containing protein [Intestinibacter sp.]MCI6736542.1 NAD(P)-binding domain-containing protein [Intestinibacter sp.]
MNVGVLGCGKMGSVVAKKLPDDVNKIIVDRNQEKLEALSKSIDCKYSTSIDILADADIVAVILPESEVNKNVESICEIAKDKAIILNMSTNGAVDDLIKQKYKSINIVETKIIGQSSMIEKFKAPSAIVIGSEDEDIVEKIKYIFKDFSYVESGDVEKVPLAVQTATRQAIVTCMDLKEKLNALDVDTSWQEALFKCVLNGTIGSFMDDTLGPFARKIVKEIEDSRQ